MPRTSQKFLFVVLAGLGFALPSVVPAVAQAKATDKQAEADQTKAAAAADFAKIVAKVDAAKAKAPLSAGDCGSFADDFVSFSKKYNAPQGYFNAGVLQQQCGTPSKSEALYNQALQADAKFAPAIVNLGDMAYKAGNISAAASQYDAALKADPKNVQAYNGAALILVEKATKPGAPVDKAMLNDAIGKLRRALAVDADSMPAYALLAFVYYTTAESDRSKLDLAELVCKQAKDVNDKYPQIYNTLGLIKLRKKNVTGALKEFKAAAELDPKYVEAQLNIGAITLSARDYATAEKAFRAVLDAKPTKADQLFDATMGLGVALRGERRIDEAEATYANAKTLDPKNCAVTYNTGVLYQDYKTTEDNSHLNKAKQFFNDFIACGPSGKADKDKLDDTKRRIKDIDDTFKAIEEAKKMEAENKVMLEEARKMEEQAKKQQEEYERQQKLEEQKNAKPGTTPAGGTAPAPAPAPPPAGGAAPAPAPAPGAAAAPPPAAKPAETKANAAPAPAK